MSLQQFNQNAKGYLAGVAMLASAAMPLSAQADAPEYPRAETAQEVSEMTNQEDCSRGLVGEFHISDDYKSTRALESAVRRTQGRITIVKGANHDEVALFYCGGEYIEKFSDTARDARIAARTLGSDIRAGDSQIAQQSKIPFNQRRSNTTLDGVQEDYPGTNLKEQLLPPLLTPSL